MEDEAAGMVDEDGPACVALLFASEGGVKSTMY